MRLVNPYPRASRSDKRKVHPWKRQTDLFQETSQSDVHRTSFETSTLNESRCRLLVSGDSNFRRTVHFHDPKTSYSPVSWPWVSRGYWTPRCTHMTHPNPNTDTLNIRRLYRLGSTVPCVLVNGGSVRGTIHLRSPDKLLTEVGFTRLKSPLQFYKEVKVYLDLNFERDDIEK